MLLAMACTAAIAGAAAPAATSPSPGTALVSGSGIAAAKTYALQRRGTVAFAVLDGHGRLRGLRRTRQFPSASVVKAMIMVEVLRRAGSRPVGDATAKLLRPMIVVSGNKAAKTLNRQLGAGALDAVARAAHMRRFGSSGDLFSTQITAADQARLFLRIDGLVPAAHRALARSLLASIVGAQRWGIAPAAARRHFHIMFKGGWRKGITHQVALLEKHGRRIALAILTEGAPSQSYGRQTLEGIAARVLR